MTEFRQTAKLEPSSGREGGSLPKDRRRRSGKDVRRSAILGTLLLWLIIPACVGQQPLRLPDALPDGAVLEHVVEASATRLQEDYVERGYPRIQSATRNQYDQLQDGVDCGNSWNVYDMQYTSAVSAAEDFIQLPQNTALMDPVIAYKIGSPPSPVETWTSEGAHSLSHRCEDVIDSALPAVALTDFSGDILLLLGEHIIRITYTGEVFGPGCDDSRDLLEGDPMLDLNLATAHLLCSLNPELVAQTEQALLASAVQQQFPNGNQQVFGQTEGNSSWPVIGHDLQHTGCTESVGLGYPGVQWSFHPNSEEFTAAVLGSGGRVFVASYTGVLYALAPDGTQEWSTELDGRVGSSPTIDQQGNIFVGTDDGVLHKILPDGTRDWRRETEGAVECSPVVHPNGLILVPTEDGVLHAFRANGAQEWSVTVSEGREVSTPAVSNTGEIYVLTETPYDWISLMMITASGELAVSMQDLREGCGTSVHEWNYPVVGDDGTIYYTSGHDAVAAVSPRCSADGFKWEFIAQPIGSEDVYLNTAPCIGPDGTVYVGSNHGIVYAISSTGEQKWAIDLQGGGIDSPIAIDGRGILYAGTSLGLAAVNPTGTVEFSADWIGFRAPVLAGDGSIYALGNVWELFKLVEIGDEPQLIDADGEDMFVNAVALRDDGTALYCTEHALYSSNHGGAWARIYECDEGIESPPVLGEDDMIYFSTSEALVACNPDGSEQWRYPIETCSDWLVHGGPALGTDGTVYVSSAEYLACVEQDGSERWRFAPDDQFYTWPVVGVDGDIMIGDLSGIFYCLSQDGIERWRYQPEFRDRTVVVPPAVGAQGTAYVPFDGTLVAISRLGEELWRFVVPNCIDASPVVSADEVIYFGAGEYLYGVSRVGRLIGQYQAESYIRCTPAIAADGTVFITCDSGHVYALTSNLETKWIIPDFWSYYCSITIGPQGELYMPNREGDPYDVFSVVTGCGGPSPGPWVSYRGNAQHTASVPQAAIQEALSDEYIAEAYLPIIMQLECDIDAVNGVEYVAYNVEHTGDCARIEYSVVFSDEDHPILDPLYDAKRFLEYGGITDIETFYVTVDLESQTVTEISFQYPYEAYCSDQTDPASLDDLLKPGPGTWACDQEYTALWPTHHCAVFSEDDVQNTFEMESGRPVLYVATWNHLFFAEPPTGMPDDCGEWHHYDLESIEMVESSRAELESRRGDSADSDCQPWQRTLGGASDDSIQDVHFAETGEVVLLGTTHSLGHGGADIWLVSLDRDGHTLWERTYGWSGEDYALRILPYVNGGYAILGVTDHDASQGWCTILIRTNSSGEEEWSRVYCRDYSFVGTSFISTPDDDLVLLLAYADPTTQTGTDLHLLQVDPSGEPVWERTYGGSGSDWPAYHSDQHVQGMVTSAEGGQVILATTDSFGASGKDLWLISTDAAGNVRWSTMIGGGNDDEAVCLQIDSAGGYIVVGEEFGRDGLVLTSVDETGATKWSRAIGGTRSSSEFLNFWDMERTDDGGQIVVGYDYPYPEDNAQVWAVKLNAAGDVEWENWYGGDGYDFGRAIEQTTDGGFVILGVTHSDSQGSGDLCLIKIDEHGMLEWDATLGGEEYDGHPCSLLAIREDVEGSYLLVGSTESYGAGERDVWIIRYCRQTDVPIAAATPESIYPVYDYPLSPLGATIDIPVGSSVETIEIAELDETYPVESGALHLDYLDIYKVLASGSSTLTLIDGSSNEEHEIELQFSLPENEALSFLAEAGHTWISGLDDSMLGLDVWEGSIGIPKSAAETYVLSWRIEHPNLQSYVDDLDAMLRMVQFTYLLLDPQVKTHLEERLQDAAQQGVGALREIYDEIEVVREAMHVPDEVVIEIPDIELGIAYQNEFFGQLFTHTIDLTQDDDVRVWITADPSDHMLDPGGVILHVQTSVFDLNQLSEVLKLTAEAGSTATGALLDLLGAIGTAANPPAGQAAETVGDLLLGSLADLGGFAAKSLISLGSVFIDFESAFAVSLIQERGVEPFPSTVGGLVDVLENSDRYILNYPAIDLLSVTGDVLAPYFGIPVLRSLAPLLGVTTDAAVLQLGVGFGLYIGDETTSPFAYDRMVTDLVRCDQADASAELEITLTSPLWPTEARFYSDLANWEWDTGDWSVPFVFFKLEGVSTDDLIKKLWGLAEVQGEIVADFLGLVAGKVVELVLPVPAVDTAAKSITRRVVADIASAVGASIAEFAVSYIYEAVYDAILQAAEQAIGERIPELPNLDVYSLLYGTSLMALPSGWITSGSFSLPLSFEETIEIYATPLLKLLECNLSCSVEFSYSFEETGTEVTQGFFAFLAEQLTGVDLTPPAFKGLTRATPIEHGIELTWDEAVDPSSPVTYAIYVSDEAGDQDFEVADFTTTDTLFTLSDLCSSDTRYVVVRARDSSGNEDENEVELAARPMPSWESGLGDLWRIRLASHADLHLYDSDGHHVGLNYETGEAEEQIVGATYRVFPDGTQEITVPDLATKVHRVELVGTGNGGYELTSDVLRDDQVVTSYTTASTIRRSQIKTALAPVVVGDDRLAVVQMEAPITVPEQPTMRVRGTGVEVTWPRYEDQDADVLGYNIYRREVGSEDYVRVNAEVETGASYRDENIGDMTAYEYAVAAVLADGRETPRSGTSSAEASVTRGLRPWMLILMVLGGLIAVSVSAFFGYRWVRSRSGTTIWIRQPKD